LPAVIPNLAVLQAERESALSERSEPNGDLARVVTATRSKMHHYL